MYERIRLHFSEEHQTSAIPLSGLPVAREFGVENAVTEHPLAWTISKPLTVQVRHRRF